jgi:predicted phage terminase large subunit-like protein
MSLAEILAADPGLLDLATDDEIAVIVAALQAEARAAGDHYFPQARPTQLPPEGDWRTWLIMSGRGFGKTRTGAEWIVDEALEVRGSYAVAAPDFGDGRDICIEGESGVLEVLRRRRPDMHLERVWNRSLGELTLPNGSRLKVVSAEKPDGFRGWNFAGAWCDELAAWPRADAWTQLRLANRLGRARTLVTTTPRPVKLVKDLVAREGAGVHITRGGTYENAANLSDEYLEEIERTYAGTRIGRQELYGELLLDTPGALWTLAMIDPHRVADVPPLQRIVVAIDPAVTSGDDADMTGLVVAGLGYDGHLYVIADRTLRASPERWAQAAVDLFDEYEADRIVAEVNNGGDLVESVLRAIDPNVPVRSVHASRGKRVRAEPVAALYEQGRVHHAGALADLEDQLTGWTPESGTSPDRLDALVWAITDLAIENPGKRRRRIVNTSAA